MASELHMEFITQHNATTPFMLSIPKEYYYIFFLWTMCSFDWNYNIQSYESYARDNINTNNNNKWCENSWKDRENF